MSEVPVEIINEPKQGPVPVESVHVPVPGTLRIFKCRRGSMQYIFRNGAVAVFKPRTHEQAGHYLTDDPQKIAELEHVIKTHPHLYKDENEFEVEAALADPAIAARAKIQEETKKQMLQSLADIELLKAAGIDPEAMKKLLSSTQDFGSYKQNDGQLQGIANSSNVNAAAADSNGVPATAVPKVAVTIKPVI